MLPDGCNEKAFQVGRRDFSSVQLKWELDQNENEMEEVSVGPTFPKPLTLKSDTERYTHLIQHSP